MVFRFDVILPTSLRPVIDSWDICRVVLVRTVFQSAMNESSSRALKPLPFTAAWIYRL